MIECKKSHYFGDTKNRSKFKTVCDHIKHEFIAWSGVLSQQYEALIVLINIFDIFC